MVFFINFINKIVKYLRISILLVFLFGFLLLAGEIFLVVTNSNRSDFYPNGEQQDMSSGLYSAYVNQVNSEYRNIKSKCALMVDFDLDKDPDLYYGWEDSYYFINKGGVFTSPESENISITGAYGLVAGDIDNNGYPDILKWRYNITDIHEILLNRGGHYFDTYSYFEADEFENMHSNGLLDYDLDGDLDIVTISAWNNPQFHLLENIGLDENGIPQFELKYEFGTNDTSSSRCLAIIDYDNDGDQDVFIVRKWSQNWLMRNETITGFDGNIQYNENLSEPFVNIAMEVNLTDSDVSDYGSQGYGAAWGDYDNDEDFDLYLVNWGVNRLFINNNGLFENIASNEDLEGDSLGNGISWGDFDNDGNNDIWTTNMRNADDLFSITSEGWSNEFSAQFLSSGQDVITSDYDMDGWLDIFVPGLNMGSDGTPVGPKFVSLLYNNQTKHEYDGSKNWLKIILEGSNSYGEQNYPTNKANKSAIGARVKVSAGGNLFSREIIAGKGHGSMDDLILHFGLGNVNNIDQIEIIWPSFNEDLTGLKTSIYQNYPVDTLLTFVEDFGLVGYKGDCNLDGDLNILDITLYINIVLNQIDVDDYTFWHMNLDYNEYLNIIDIVRLVTKILTM
ncbi:MAG: hypothetical protein CMF96_05890 [Candidatus Marinimicrobia bacterium]|nr:hypothetical protein [Candidatus Neomarinimicrobiota bacterium]|tara:strand:- start:2842 stop:4701 length:1860 start_codon:yes stop_codon:yes gene_type:complete